MFCSPIQTQSAHIQSFHSIYIVDEHQTHKITFILSLQDTNLNNSMQVSLEWLKGKISQQFIQVKSEPFNLDGTDLIGHKRSQRDIPMEQRTKNTKHLTLSAEAQEIQLHAFCQKSRVISELQYYKHNCCDRSNPVQ